MVTVSIFQIKKKNKHTLAIVDNNVDIILTLVEKNSRIYFMYFLFLFAFLIKYFCLTVYRYVRSCFITLRPRSPDPFYKVSYFINRVETSWTDSTVCIRRSDPFYVYKMGHYFLGIKYKKPIFN